ASPCLLAAYSTFPHCGRQRNHAPKTTDGFRSGKAAPSPTTRHPRQPLGTAEIAEWRARQTRRRSYELDVLGRIESLRARFDVEAYGRLEYAPDSYPLFAIRGRDWRDELPVMLVTGGVHGYETSGVHGALGFVERHAQEYAGRINLLVAPC